MSRAGRSGTLFTLLICSMRRTLYFLNYQTIELRQSNFWRDDDNILKTGKGIRNYIGGCWVIGGFEKMRRIRPCDWSQISNIKLQVARPYMWFLWRPVLSSLWSKRLALYDSDNNISGYIYDNISETLAKIIRLIRLPYYYKSETV